MIGKKSKAYNCERCAQYSFKNRTYLVSIKRKAVRGLRRYGGGQL